MIPTALLPSRISGQIAIMIVVSLVVIHAILTLTFFLERRDSGGPEGPPVMLGPFVELLDRTAIEERPRVVADIARAYPQLEIALADVAPVVAGESGDESRLKGLRHFLGRRFRTTLIDRGTPPDGPRVAVHLGDGQVVTARLPPNPPKPPHGFGPPLAITLLTIAISTSLLGLWAARGLTAPLRAFAHAAEGFSPDAEIAPLPEGGPDEIRSAARALNRMRERIKRLIDDRTRMLAAVGHDLRTPITRLRLRSEFIDDVALRGQMLDDLEQMNAMVESVLIFLCEGRTQEDPTVIDVATSLQTICDQFADTGLDVRYDGPNHVSIEAQPNGLHRAVTNLISNAVRHGAMALVRLTVDRGLVVIAVEDDGPGIPDDRKAAMFEPFVRGDAARHMDGQSGFGLGLSIARAVVAAHNGTLTLLDRDPHGLIARIELPLGQQVLKAGLSPMRPRTAAAE
jgi:signal transduction histidine kinase